MNKGWVPIVDPLYDDIDVKISYELSVTLERDTKLFVKQIKQEESI